MSPTTVLANEKRATFGEFIRNRRQSGSERHSWRFEVHARFDQTISAEEFEQSVTHTPLRLAAVPGNNQPQVDLELVESIYDHPHHDSNRGTRVTFIFDVTLTPV